MSSGDRSVAHDEAKFNRWQVMCELYFITMLMAGADAVARFDFSHGDSAYHQQTLENLKTAMRNTKKLCAVSHFIRLLFSWAMRWRGPLTADLGQRSF